MSKFFNQKNQGFTLVETLVAVSIFSVSILGLMSVLGQGISNTTYAKQRIIAGYLAQEGIEYIRNVRDNYVLYPATGLTWAGFEGRVAACNASPFCGFNASIPETSANAIFLCSPATLCNLYVNNGNYNANSSGVDSGFTRKIQRIDTGVPDEVKISSTVSWAQGSGVYSITFSETLYNWTE